MHKHLSLVLLLSDRTADQWGYLGLRHGCCADDRYGQKQASSVTAAEADRMQFYEATLHINRLFAARHGYRFAYQGSDKYAWKGLRHMSWMKLQMLRDELECCCQWALFMDSDSFLVMQDQRYVQPLLQID